MLLYACTEKEFSNKVEIEIIPQFAQLSPDSTVNYEMSNLDTTENEIICFKFYNSTPRNLYFLTDDYSNNITSFRTEKFLNGELGRDIMCSFGDKTKVMLAPLDSVLGYVFTNKSSREYDSTVIEFLFYDVVDDAEYGYKIKR